jgi:N-acetylmuramate 1-kinase
MNGEGYKKIPASLHPMDDRFRALEAWLAASLGAAPAKIERASTDASFRRYFRVFVEDRTLIAMDAPPDREDSRPFVKVAGLLLEAGLNAPRILEHDLAQGFLLVTDLGTTSYLAALNAENADRLFDDAATALVRWQASGRAGVLPDYDEALLARELQLFPDWYLAKHLGVTLGPAQRDSLEKVFRAILAVNLAEPRVFVHRDFMPRNLMVCEPNPGILDFQDAVFGPVSYDIACLYRDAFVSWDEERVLDGTIRYWEKARRAKLPVPADFALFWRDVEWMGLQRHLKVLGIFARLAHRDGKKGYVEDTPRFLGYVRHAVARYDELAPLGRLLDEVEGRRPEARYTF